MSCDAKALITQLEKVIQYYRLPNEAIAAMEDIISALREGDHSVAERLSLLFAPTGLVQEISINSGWGDEFLVIAEQVDVEIKKLG